jgi:hypothetical protein
MVLLLLLLLVHHPDGRRPINAATITAAAVT